jgi:hypothetical protein
LPATVISSILQLLDDVLCNYMGTTQVFKCLINAKAIHHNNGPEARTLSAVFSAYPKTVGTRTVYLFTFTSSSFEFIIALLASDVSQSTAQVRLHLHTSANFALVCNSIPKVNTWFIR